MLYEVITDRTREQRLVPGPLVGGIVAEGRAMAQLNLPVVAQRLGVRGGRFHRPALLVEIGALGGRMRLSSPPAELLVSISPGGKATMRRITFV